MVNTSTATTRNSMPFNIRDKGQPHNLHAKLFLSDTTKVTMQKWSKIKKNSNNLSELFSLFDF